MTLEQEKQALLAQLQTAMELELSTIPPYLVALLSIRKEANRVPANLIRSVMMEEMLHMVLVGNVVSGLGGAIKLGGEHMPSYPLRLEFNGKTFRNREFDVNLEAFSPHSLDIFLQIEIPDSLLARRVMRMATPKLDIPGITIGDFYEAIIAKLEELCERFPEAEVFCGEPGRQIGVQYYWGAGGKPIVVTSLDTARQALRTIVTQGEGGHDSIDDSDSHYFDQPEEVAHYFRFNEIKAGRHYRPGDKPHDPPSGEPIAVDYTAVYPIKRNARHDDYAPGSALANLNEAFNRQYSLMLSQLETAFNGTPTVLYNAIVNGMHALGPIAIEMMSQPIDATPGSPHGAPSFEWIAPPSA